MLLALTAKFNLKIIQFDAVNVFIYINLDKTVFICIPFGYGKNGKVLRLNKVLYSLQ